MTTTTEREIMEAVANRDAVPVKRAKRKHEWRTDGPNGDVAVERTNPEVWAKARKMAGGDVSRLQRIDAETVIVHNSANWRKLHVVPPPAATKPKPKRKSKPVDDGKIVCEHCDAGPFGDRRARAGHLWVKHGMRKGDTKPQSNGAAAMQRSKPKLTCPHCPDREPFKKSNALGSHLAKTHGIKGTSKESQRRHAAAS